MHYAYPAKPIKSASASTAEVMLLENHGSPKYAVEIQRPDYALTLCVTDDEAEAEQAFVQAVTRL
jgi:hypothetical protein